jgi:hypothetical protein
MVASIALTCAICVIQTSTTQNGFAAPPDEVAHQVDKLLAVDLPAAPSGQVNKKCPDEVYLRRVFLDIVGQPPTPDDITAFALDSNPNKRSAVVQQLVADKAFGENWARYWRDVVFYRRTEDRAFIAAGPMTDYLSNALNEGTSWDKIASEFITAKGDVREDGRTALIMAQGGLPEETVAEVSRIFLGIQIQCAQCHDHPSDRWKREQFHHLAAFFPRVAVRPDQSAGDRTFLVTVTDRQLFRPPNGNNRFVGTLEHRMPDLENPSAPGKLMQPKFFLTDEGIDYGVSDVERRGQLAQWITSPDNEWFPKALVNRLWAELVGEGFYEPVDDLGPDRQCSAPATMDYLAKAFADSGYDVKWLMQAITATDAYQRESRGRRNPDEPPFQANCAQRLRGDQLFDSLVAALDLPQSRLPPPGRGPAPFGVQNSVRNFFNQAFGYDPSERREEVSGSVQQALALMNSPMINQAISARRFDGGLGQLLRESRDNEAVAMELYLRTLAREPSREELTICLDHVRQVGERGEAFEDILWSLVNSTEFLHRR